MRLDKYLKITRLIKRRTVAKVLIDEGNILVNGKTGKPSSNIQISDIVEIKLGSRFLKIKVLEISANANKIESKNMFEIIEDKLTT